MRAAARGSAGMSRAVAAELPLPAGLRSRIVQGVNGLDMHLLKAGYPTPGRPCVLLLHGVPELACLLHHVRGARRRPGATGVGSPTPRLTMRQCHVGVGCMFAVVGTLLATAWHRSAQRVRGR
jgi:hypothetical protein